LIGKTRTCGTRELKEQGRSCRGCPGLTLGAHVHGSACHLARV